MSLQLSKTNATIVGDEINKYTKLYETLCKRWYNENNINECNLPIIMFMKLTWDYQKKRYNELKNGQVGSMLNVIGVEEIRALQT